MSTLLEQASLVLIPSGYKEDTVYSVIPSNGSGDMSFTRASNGTRINSDGLVEVCPWNLLQQSETFNTTWSASNTVVTANQTTAPNGTTTADLLVDNTNNTNHALTQSVTNLSVGLDYYYSIYVKNNNHTWVLLRHDNGGTFNYFNIATGVKGTNTQANSTIENVGNGWYKLTVPFNVASSSSGPEFYLASADGTYIYAGTGTGVYIWGASYTLSAKPYFPTTDRLNVPRLTYQNGGGGCPSLLLEPQRTNLLTYSEDFSNAAWQLSSSNAGANPVITTNNTISPDGTQNADKVVFVAPASGDISQISQVTALTGTATGSIYFKAFSSGDVGKIIAVRFNQASYELVTLTADWQRFSVTQTALTSFDIVLRPSEGTSTGTVSVYMWGAQLEAGAYQSSYIPTVASSATRIADACSKTGISSLIGQTEGTVFCEFQTLENLYAYIGVDDTTTTNRIIFFGVGDNKLYTQLRDATGTIFTEGTNVINGKVKAAISFNSSGSVFYANGVQIHSDLGASYSTLSQFTFNHASQIGAVINQAILFPTRLTNAQLVTLTTI